MATIKKESIKLRKRLMKSGTISLYLDIYRNGKREYEYLKMYLHSKPVNTQERNHNKETLKLAQAVYAKRVIDMQNSVHGFLPTSKLDTSFLKYFGDLANSKGREDGVDNCWEATLTALEEYCSESLTFRSVDQDFVQGFRDFLDKYKGQYSKSISRNSKSIYFTKFRSAINAAVRGKYLLENPITNVPTIKMVESERTYLTMNQVEILANTDCKHPTLKRAFLFSCLTGIRISDIAALQWKHIKSFGSGTRIVFQQEKTEGLEYLDISEHAVKFLGNRSEHSEFVFPNVNKNPNHGPKLKEWCASAGIEEEVTFHTARHTFAVMMITLDVDIYTVSKLLGHKDIATTQIYAKIVDKVKQEAVQKIPEIGIHSIPDHISLAGQ